MARALGIGRSWTDGITGFVIRWVILAVAVWVAAELVDGITYDGWLSIFAVALILGLLNVFVKPALTLVTLPLTIITLGLFLIVINTLLFALTGRLAIEIEEIDFAIAGIPGDFFWQGFRNSLLGAIIVSIVAWVLGLVASGTGMRR